MQQLEDTFVLSVRAEKLRITENEEEKQALILQGIANIAAFQHTTSIKQTPWKFRHRYIRIESTRAA
jgi:parvulin-like peptidyl-prolyl isomerase